MHLNDKVYDVLKWVTMIMLPALGTLYFGLAGIWQLPNADQVVGTVVVVTTFLGALLGLSTVTYNKSDAKYDGTLVVDNTDPDKDTFSFDLKEDPYSLVDKRSLTFKVSKSQ